MIMGRWMSGPRSNGWRRSEVTEGLGVGPIYQIKCFNGFGACFIGLRGGFS